MKITKTRLREIIKEELEHAMSEQRPPLPPPPPKKGSSAGVEQGKTYNRFANIIQKVIVNGLGELASSQNEVRRAMMFFLGRASGKPVRGRGMSGITKLLDSMSEREATDLLRKTYALVGRNIKTYAEARKIQYDQLQKTRAQAGDERGVKSRKLSPEEIEQAKKAEKMLQSIK